MKKKTKWVLLVENENSASDPYEVIYSLSEIDETGEIIRTDCFIDHCNIGFLKHLKEAVNEAIYKKIEIKPARSAQTKAIKA